MPLCWTLRATTGPSTRRLYDAYACEAHFSVCGDFFWRGYGVVPQAFADGISTRHNVHCTSCPAVTPAFTQHDNQVFISGLRSALESNGSRVTVYCGLGWNDYFGANFTAFSDLPVIYAHYDNVPSYYDAVDHPYGGWAHASGKQFWDGAGGETLCGTGALDWDWSPKPFW